MAQMTSGYRHAGFVRSRRVTRALSVLALALTGVFSFAASHAFGSRKPALARTEARAPVVEMFPNDPEAPNLAPPVRAPRAARRRALNPPVVSGGS